MSREGSCEIKYLYYGCIFQLAPDEDCCDEHCTRNCWETPGTNGRGRLASGEKPKISSEPLGIFKDLNVFRGVPSAGEVIGIFSHSNFAFCIPQKRIPCSYFLFPKY